MYPIIMDQSIYPSFFESFIIEHLLRSSWKTTIIYVSVIQSLAIMPNVFIRLQN